MDAARLSASEFAASPGVGDWRYRLGAIHVDFLAAGFAHGGDLIREIAAAADSAGHHPDVTLLYPNRVRVTLTTHAAGGITELDVELAREISRLASSAGAVAEPARGASYEVTIDVLDIEACWPFWAAVMGDYHRTGHRTLADPLRAGPVVCFQQLDEPRPQRNRVHVDVSVPHDVADERVAAALAAGGTLVSDVRARAFWVLADPEGNEACICTWQDR